MLFRFRCLTLAVKFKSQRELIFMNPDSRHRAFEEQDHELNVLYECLECMICMRVFEAERSAHNDLKKRRLALRSRRAVD
jgi:hypothetical protein